MNQSRVKTFSGKLVSVGTRLDGGTLDFEAAKIGDLARLKELYDRAWGKDLEISESQLGAKIEKFREGQIVGRRNGKIVSMINVMLTSFGEATGIEYTYDGTTGNRTFSTHIKPEVLFEIVRDTRSIPVALCVSIAVDPEEQRSGAAVETINFARRFVNENGIYAVAYSAPRSMAKARKELGIVGINEYLKFTRARKQEYGDYCEKIFDNQQMRAIRILLSSGELPIGEGRYNQRSSDLRHFDKVRSEYLDELVSGITIEEFCLAYGRELYDVVLGMHMKNGARFIRKSDGSIMSFSESRQDPLACGYNVPMAYDPHEYFNNIFF